MMTDKEKTLERLNIFLVEAQKIARNNLTIEMGKRYAKVVQDGRSVYCFIDLTNGNVLKAASWKAPVKINPRSNIFDSDAGASGLDVYGCKYLR